MKNAFNARSLVRDTRGANMVEYIILVGVIALLGIGAFKTFGQSMAGKAQEQAGEISKIGK